MPTPTPRLQPPARILLATDLSPRCDRALDRAVQLHRQWAVPLSVLNVRDRPAAPDEILRWASGQPTPDEDALAQCQILADLSHLGVQADVRLVRASDTVATITDVATQTGAGLVVTGVARDEPLGRFSLGTTVERLARTLELPLLIVRTRPHGPYTRVVVASDLTPWSGQAVRTAISWFPEGKVEFFHAERTPGVVSRPSLSDPVRPASPEQQRRCAEFLESLGLSGEAFSAVTAVEGTLELSLTHHVRSQCVDLVVIGTHESRGLLDALLGDSLERLLQWLPCDLLVVPPQAA